MAGMFRKIIQINFLLSAAVLLFLLLHLSQLLKEHPSESGSVPYLFIQGDDQFADLAEWPPPANQIIMEYMIALVIEAGVLVAYLFRSRLHQRAPRALAGLCGVGWIMSSLVMPLWWHDAYGGRLIFTNVYFVLWYVAASHLAYAFSGNIPEDDLGDNDD